MILSTSGFCSSAFCRLVHSSHAGWLASCSKNKAWFKRTQSSGDRQGLYGASCQNFWAGQICGRRPTFYKRSIQGRTSYLSCSTHFTCPPSRPPPLLPFPPNNLSLPPFFPYSPLISKRSKYSQGVWGSAEATPGRGSVQSTGGNLLHFSLKILHLATSTLLVFQRTN